MADSNRLNFYQNFKIQDESSRLYNPDPLGIQHPRVTVVTAATSGGKSNFLMSMIVGRPYHNASSGLMESQSAFDRVVIFSGSQADEVLYDRAAEMFKNHGKDFQRLTIDQFPEWKTSLEQELQDVGGDRYDLPQTLCVFDDILTGVRLGKELIGFGTYSRKLNCSTVILSQKYAKIPIEAREQARYFVLLSGLPKRTVSHIYDACINAGVDEHTFRAVYLEATKNHRITDFMLVDLNAKPDRSVRVGYTKFVKID
jgi:hypothetical protein